MPAWFIAAIQDIHDPAGWAEYLSLAGPTLAKYGGKVVFSGDKIEVPEGNWSPANVAAVEFESLQRAKEWYNSPEYRAAVSVRQAAAEVGVVLLDGG